MIADEIPACPACGTLIAESKWQRAQWECPNSRCGRLFNAAEVVA
jgi:predicted RNA-binding Zn-ribbon protein involved in translation (DUF1610 family)